MISAWSAPPPRAGGVGQKSTWQPTALAKTSVAAFHSHTPLAEPPQTGWGWRDSAWKLDPVASAAAATVAAPAAAARAWAPQGVMKLERSWSVETAATAPIPPTATRSVAPHPTSFETQALAARSSKADKARTAMIQVVEWATRLGVIPADGDGDDGKRRELRTSALQRALSTFDAGKVNSTLGWVERYVAVIGGETLFLPMAHAADLEATAHNQGTLDAFAEYIRASGSRAKGRQGAILRSDTIQEYAGILRLVRETCVGPIVVPGAAARASRLFKAMRKEDGPPGSRDSRRAFRAMHFRRLIASGFDRRSHARRTEWEMAITAHNLLLRGGEVGGVEGGQFDPTTGLVWRCIEWKSSCKETQWRPWAIVWVMAIKDQSVKNTRQPIVIVRRHRGERGDDPLCVYDAMAARWEREVGPLPRQQTSLIPFTSAGQLAGCEVVGRLAANQPMAAKPIFTRADGSAYDTGDVRAVAKRMAKACGEDPDRFGGKSFRVGGATDMRAVFGTEGMHKIVQRGRWHSDIAQIYQRTLLSEQVDGATRVADADGEDMESMVQGWSQPAATAATRY